MRTPKYLSPSSVMTWRNNREEFYLRYLADHKCPDMPQTRPMSVGASFDAYIKNYLAENLLGKSHKLWPKYEFKSIFENQVEPQNRDWALAAGKHVFECYLKCGACADLMRELQSALHEPRMEFAVEARVPHTRVKDGIPLMGKPDLFFITKTGLFVPLDFKVNGYCGRSPTSPKKEYIALRTIDGGLTTHKNAMVMDYKGFKINVASHMENIDEDWARQVTMYNWLFCEGTGMDFVAAIEQIVAAPGCVMPGSESALPTLRVASHRCRVSQEYQDRLLEELAGIWSAISCKAIFGLEHDAEIAKQRELDDRYLAFTGSEPYDKWFTEMMRKHDR